MAVEKKHLSELLELERIRIAARIYPHPNWHKIGPFFEKYGFLITHQSLVAQYQGRGDNFLCEALLQQLAARLIKIEDFTAALESPDVGLNAVAAYIKNKEYLQSPQQADSTSNEPTIQTPSTIPLAINKLLIIPHNEKKLYYQFDKILTTVGFEQRGVSSTHVLWKYTLPNPHDCYVLKIFGTKESAAPIKSALKFTSEVLFLLVNDKEKAEYLDLEEVPSKLEALPMPAKLCFRFVFRALKEETFKDIPRQFYGIPRTCLDLLDEDEELMYWPGRNIETGEHKVPNHQIHLCFEFKEVDKKLEEIRPVVRKAVTMITGVETNDNGGAFHSIDIFLSGPTILPILIELYQKEIFQSLKNSGLELIYIYEIFVQDIIELRHQPKNDPYRAELYELVEKMICDGISMQLPGSRNRWSIDSTTEVLYKQNRNGNLRRQPDFMGDQNIESKCTGFSIELKKEQPISYVKNLLEDNNAAHFGLNTADIQKYESVPTLFHVTMNDAAKNSKSLDEVFNYTANFAVGNATVINFIEPTFETVIPPAVTREGIFSGVGHVIRDWFKRILGKRTEEDEVFANASKNKTWPFQMLKITEDLKNYLKGKADAYKDKLIVAHPDTGYMLHPDIVPNVDQKLSRNFFKPKQKDEPGYSDGSTHGTATASIIIGKEYGVAHEEAMIVPLRTRNSVIYFSWEALEQGLDYAIKLDTCHVISMSLGGPVLSRTVMKLIDAAIQKGIIVLAAAGNYTGPWVVFPANYEPVIAVAACGENFQLWENSAYGKAVSVTAPGYGVYRAIMDKNQPTFEPSSGTSYAVSHVAGLAVLWMKYYGHKIEPRLRQQTFKNLLRDSEKCTPVQGAKAGTYGGGIAKRKNCLSLFWGQKVLPWRMKCRWQWIRKKSKIERVS